MRSGIQGMGILSSIVLGGVVGWLAGKIMRGRGFGVIANIVVGMISSFIGGCLLGLVKGNMIMDRQ